MKLWGRLFHGEKSFQSKTVSCAHWQEGLHELCQAFDVPRPIVLGKHEREMEEFAHTVFRPDDFVEPLGCDRFLREILPEKKKR